MVYGSPGASFLGFSTSFEGKFMRYARARSLGSHRKAFFNGLDGESGLTVHGAGVCLVGQVVDRFARNTMGGVSVVESLADDSPFYI
jgi:hypothetical protein